MSQDETDPGASTDRFRAFVEGGEADRSTGRRSPSAAVGIMLLLVVALAAVIWLLV